ncbi:FAD-binding protein [Microbacterium hatanonis]|uniref:FAD-binding protein n=1 Tax=Microbacterium hatanonis TaxID=404366 RepID=A0A5C8I4T7_9MICO|nr:FAD-binding protein [Microbacterium hatanonis]
MGRRVCRAVTYGATQCPGHPYGGAVATAFVKTLRDLLSDGAVIDDPPVVAEHAFDASRTTAPVAAVLVRPRSTREVSAVLRAANDAGVPVVPQGARSGLVGAAAAIDGAVLLDLGALDRIVRIDPVDRIAVVQPGVVVADLQRAAAAVGLFYPPDPASAEWASIGGTIATNAGGMRCVKYGVTRDAVRSLEAVLADGEIVRTRAETVKGVAGLDLTSLFVGSEGTLGVITEATLALRPAPGPSRGVSAIFRDAASAFAAANVIASGSRLPSTLEFLDEVALRGIRLVRPELGIPDSAQAWLLAVTDEVIGSAEDLDGFEAAFLAHGAQAATRADDPEQLDHLFAARRALSPALVAVRGGATHGDLAVPRSQLPVLADAVVELRLRLGVEISLAGHVGDGNLHPTVVFDPGDADETARAREAEHELLVLAQRLGGTVAGEHGIGSVKLHAVDGEVPPRIRELQRAVKSVFDPRGILNPGRKL